MEKAQKEHDQATLDKDQSSIEKDKAVLERDVVELEQNRKVQETTANRDQLKSDFERLLVARSRPESKMGVDEAPRASGRFILDSHVSERKPHTWRKQRKQPVRKAVISNYKKNIEGRYNRHHKEDWTSVQCERRAAFTDAS